MDTRNRRVKGDTYSPDQIKRVLTGSGLTVETEIDTDYILFCPFHPNHRTPAGEVDKFKGTFFCFSCHHVASLVELVMHATARTYFESVRFIKTREQQTNIETDVNKALIIKPDYVPYDKDTIIRLGQEALINDRAVSYFAGRQITKESMAKFKLGYSEKQDMVTVPVSAPDGTPVGFVGRSVEGKVFKNTPGLPKAKVLFNLHRVKNEDSVYVVESSFDAIRLDQCGIPAVATLGANVSNFQIDLLKKYFNNIYVVADNDEAGGNMKTRIYEKLSSRVTVIQLDKQYKDIGEMNDEDIRNIEMSFDKSISAMLQ